LIDLEIEHHLQTLTGSTEIVHIDVREYICFSENNGIAYAPIQEFAEGAKHIVLLNGTPISAFCRNDKWHSVHAKSGDA